MHAERIAWLVLYPAEDPIEIDVGVPILGYHIPWPVLDGNHRLAAAIFRKDLTILVAPAGQCAVIDRYRWAPLKAASKTRL